VSCYSRRIGRAGGGRDYLKIILEDGKIYKNTVK